MNARASTLNAAALTALERAVDTALGLDSATRAQVDALAGKVFCIDCTVPAVRVYVAPGAGELRLYGHYEGEVACTVSGAASDFVALAGAADKAGALVNGNLRISGDSAPLLELEKALGKLELDWEQRLALLVGDVAAHQFGRAVRGSARWGQGAQASFARHVEEFIHEEARLAPPRLEVEDFFGDLRATAQRTERLEAGLRRLSRRIGALAAARDRNRGG
jgi:ubiquinone biosynthesis accessory factor UbiJ